MPTDRKERRTKINGPCADATQIHRKDAAADRWRWKNWNSLVASIDENEHPKVKSVVQLLIVSVSIIFQVKDQGHSNSTKICRTRSIWLTVHRLFIFKCKPIGIGWTRRLNSSGKYFNYFKKQSRPQPRCIEWSKRRSESIADWPMSNNRRHTRDIIVLYRVSIDNKRGSHTLRWESRWTIESVVDNRDGHYRIGKQYWKGQEEMKLCILVCQEDVQVSSRTVWPFSRRELYRCHSNWQFGIGKLPLICTMVIVVGQFQSLWFLFGRTDEDSVFDGRARASSKREPQNRN